MSYALPESVATELAFLALMISACVEGETR